CDELQIDGTLKPGGGPVGTYSHAQKIRAAMTHTFGRVYELGSVAWHQDESTGRWRGNPSVSQQVSLYMISLRNRKARAGEVATSARAITTDVIRKLYDFNNLPENHEIQPYVPGVRRSKLTSSIYLWGGPTARRELQAIYTVAFLCLLRSDEVLKICRKHITLDHDKETITLTLNFRKTHQDGGKCKHILCNGAPC
ncbi:hypothetical protein BJ912DRAFT_847728, partial [Pholiota molesta]